MIPSFAVADVPKDRVWVAPPYFRPIRGVPRNVSIVLGKGADKRTDRTSPTQTEARKRGLSYEEKALAFLSSLYPSLITHPAITFFDDTGFRIAVPDALHIDHEYNLAIIFEVKIRHTLDAYWQLWKLYKPLLEAKRYETRCVEVVGSYDPSCIWPVECVLVDDPMCGYSPDHVSVLRYKRVRSGSSSPD